MERDAIRGSLFWETTIRASVSEPHIWVHLNATGAAATVAARAHRLRLQNKYLRKAELAELASSEPHLKRLFTSQSGREKEIEKFLNKQLAGGYIQRPFLVSFLFWTQFCDLSDVLQDLGSPSLVDKKRKVKCATHLVGGVDLCL